MKRSFGEILESYNKVLSEALSPDEILRLHSLRGSVQQPNQTAEQQPQPQPQPQPSASDSSAGGVTVDTNRSPDTRDSENVQQQQTQEPKIAVDTAWMKKWYDIFNDKYWNGQLPEIGLYTNNMSKTWGKATYSFKRRGSFCYGPLMNLKIFLSNYNVSTENVKKNTLLHEMIHIADYVFHPEHFIRDGRKVSKREYDAHGPVFFLKEADRLKADGWNIQKYVTSDEKKSSELSQGARKRLDNRKVKSLGGVLVYDTHRFIFKTDITSLDSIRSYFEKYSYWYRKNGLKSVEFYKSDSDWFNLQRSSRTSIRGWDCKTEEDYKKRVEKWKFDELPVKVWTFETLGLGESEIDEDAEKSQEIVVLDNTPGQREIAKDLGNGQIEVSIE